MKFWLLAGLCGLLGPVLAWTAGAQVEVRRIWDGAKHCAFPDMVLWGGRYWVVCRESDAHVFGKDGVTRVITSTDGEEWESRGLLEKEGVDLRDPKLSVKGDGTLVILQGGSTYEGRTLVGRQGYVSFVQKGERSPGALAPIAVDAKIRSKDDWLWRLSWNGGVGYGVIYQATASPTGHHLVKTVTGTDYELVRSLDLPGKPGESTIRFAPDGEMWMVVRNEGDDMMGSLGRSKPPYQDWTWRKLKVRLGGPDLLRLENGTWLLASRKYTAGGARTMVGVVTGEGEFNEKLVLPSGGDTSYPRMLEVGDQLWMVYYSSHEGSAAIYLAKIPLRDLE